MQDLEWCIEQDFPRGTELTPLEREKEAHIAFADVRRRVYIGRGEYFAQIDNFMMTHQKEPLVILGESGMMDSHQVAPVIHSCSCFLKWEHIIILIEGSRQMNKVSMILR